MREILFRGKSVDKNVGCKWVYGGILATTLGEKSSRADIVQFDNAYGAFVNIRVNERAIGQYTGLTDKNGKKIFEGDICRVGNLLYKVVFSYGQWNFEIISTKYYCCPCFYSNCGEYCEVIGNIFDNPELLQP